MFPIFVFYCIFMIHMVHMCTFITPLYFTKKNLIFSKVFPEPVTRRFSDVDRKREQPQPPTPTRLRTRSHSERPRRIHLVHLSVALLSRGQSLS
jgi:hypothetical protein